MEEQRTDFEKAAGQQRRHSLAGEFLGFLTHNKKWWLLPIIVLLLSFGLLLLLSSSAAAPFIYTLF